jgi:hypothetical protein
MAVRSEHLIDTGRDDSFHAKAVVPDCFRGCLLSARCEIDVGPLECPC